MIELWHQQHVDHRGSAARRAPGERLECRLDLGDDAVRGLVTQLFANRANLAKVHPALAGLARQWLAKPVEARA